MIALRSPSRLVPCLVVLALLAPSNLLWAQVNGTLNIDDMRLQGTAASGELLLYSPDPVQPGSSISHWDTSATPNLLMEPAINGDLAPLALDVTPQMMADIGWTSGGHMINIYDFSAPGTGFTDPRPFTPLPDNAATTLGEARVNLFLGVLGAWGSTLDSTVDVDVLVLWTPQFCDPNAGAVLASAGTTYIFNDPSLPFADTWYHAALTEALVGIDVTGDPLTEDGGDIVVFMNSEIDEGCLGPGTGYYYGLDGNQAANQIDVAPVVLHELGHGYGMSNFTNESTGSLIQGLPGIYDRFTTDLTTLRTWNQMNDAQRVASAVNFRKVAWNGSLTNSAAAATLTPGVPELVINAPAALAGSYEIGTASFGPSIPMAGLTGDLACQVDPIADASFYNGCTPASNPAMIAGNIALIDRGGCAFVDKVANAQAAGATAAIIINTSGNAPNNMSGTDPSITIPAISVGAADGLAIRQALCPISTTAIPTQNAWGMMILGLLLIMVALFTLYRARQPVTRG